MSLAKKHLVLLTLLAGMIFSQLAVAVHQVDFGLHDGDSACNICLHTSSTDDGGLAAFVQLPLVLNDAFITGSMASSYLTLNTHYQSRAPPHNS